MAYTDINSVQKFISQQQLLIWSQPDNNDPVNLDKEKVQDAIDEAESEINERLFSARYNIPLTGATADNLANIKGIANRLTIYNLAESNILGEEGTIERLENMYQKAQAKLTGYADGSRTIIGATQWYNQTNAPMAVPVRSSHRR